MADDAPRDRSDALVVGHPNRATSEALTSGDTDAGPATQTYVLHWYRRLMVAFWAFGGFCAMGGFVGSTSAPDVISIVVCFLLSAVIMLVSLAGLLNGLTTARLIVHPDELVYHRGFPLRPRRIARTGIREITLGAGSSASPLLDWRVPQLRLEDGRRVSLQQLRSLARSRRQSFAERVVADLQRWREGAERPPGQ
jgi:hypothetical protein